VEFNCEIKPILEEESDTSLLTDYEFGSLNGTLMELPPAEPVIPTTFRPRSLQFSWDEAFLEDFYTVPKD
jgi:hypothetical protein